VRDRWEKEHRFSAYGARMLVRPNRAALMPRLLTRLPIGSQAVADAGDFAPDRIFSIAFCGEDAENSVIRVKGQRSIVCKDEADLLDAFERNAAYRVAEAARERVFIHSGVVGWRGRAILLPGQSCYGKTTLVTRFLEAGATYYSDEYAVLDRQGWVHPYPRSLHIRREPGKLTQTVVPFGELGVTGGVGSEPIQPALMLCCRYRQDAHWQPKPLTAGAAALELMRFSFTAYWSPEAAFHAAGQTATHVEAWRGRRGEAQPVVEWALKRLDAGD
jgi:hypothetical protein